MSGVERPHGRSYVVPGTRLIAGDYPFHRDPAQGRQKLAACLAAGINAFIDITAPEDGMTPYAPELSNFAGNVRHHPIPLPDNDVPPIEVMKQVLDTIDSELAAGSTIYLHCWGGVGRTGTVVGCFLRRRGFGPEDALKEVSRLYQTYPPAVIARHSGSPQTHRQREFVRAWREPDAIGIHSAKAPGAQDRRDRIIGALVGLAVGDAVGTTLEFRRRGTFTPITDMIGGGPFGLKRGQWTDDTSMALCLAESLITCGRMDPRDQMDRYLKWYREGHLSPTGRCFDIGGTVASALNRYAADGNPIAGGTDVMQAGNGCIMRLAPVAMFFAGDPVAAIEMCGESARTTHGAPAAIDACRYLGSLLVGAFNGTSKEELLSAFYEPVAGVWYREPIASEIQHVARGSFATKDSSEIRGSGYCVESLEAALWAFHTTSSFRDGCLKAANLGDDADTTAAVYGQIAGAYYGYSGIPTDWVQSLAMRELIEAYAGKLCEHGPGLEVSA